MVSLHCLSIDVECKGALALSLRGVLPPADYYVIPGAGRRCKWINESVAKNLQPPEEHTKVSRLALSVT